MDDPYTVVSCTYQCAASHKSAPNRCYSPSAQMKLVADSTNKHALLELKLVHGPSLSYKLWCFKVR